MLLWFEFWGVGKEARKAQQNQIVHDFMWFVSMFVPFGVSKIDLWNPIFDQSGAKRRSTPLDPERPGADLGAIRHRKRSKEAFS